MTANSTVSLPRNWKPALCAWLLLLPAALFPVTARAQTLTSGGNYDGTVLLNQTNAWTFAANAGDRIVLRGAVLTTTNGFGVWLRIYNPSGVLIADSGASAGSAAEELALTAANSGTFTVLVSDSNFNGYGYGGTGKYGLYFAQFPGAFMVPAGDEGGPLASGGNYDGTIQLGDLDLWTFTGNAGDRIVLRGAVLTTTNGFGVWLRIYNPSGVLIADSGAGAGSAAEELGLTATNSGTFTVLVSDSNFNGYGYGGTGKYGLYFAQFPGAFIVPAGDEGGPLTSGGNYDGTIQLGDLDLWTFTGNAGDRIVLRGAVLTTTNGFGVWLRIYNPSGVLIADSGAGAGSAAEELALTATNSGTFTVLLSDSNFNGYGYGGTGKYGLYFAQFPGAFIVPAGDEGGPLTSGGNYDGTIQLGDLDLWTFTANPGDRIVLRGAVLTTTNGFGVWLRIYNPSGVLVADSGADAGSVAEELALTATNSGTFTVLVSDSNFNAYGYGGTGNYRLYFAQFPGAPIVPSGDEGGALTSGGNYDGTIQVGDLDLWTFTAKPGDRIVLRGAVLTTANGFSIWLRIYNPDGVLIANSGASAGEVAEELSVTVTNSGTFTVLVSDSNLNAYGYGGTGNYRLYFAQFPGAFIVLSGDEGGSLTNGVDPLGTIQLGDLDLWSFTACRGDRIAVQVDRLSTTNDFNPWLRIYNPSGVLIANSGVGGGNVTVQLTLTATNNGTFTVLVSDSNVNGYGFGGTGSYRLSSNGLSDELKICRPIVSGTNVALAGVGGVSGTTYVLLTQTNLSVPSAQWTPIRTNQFDSFGVFNYTNLFDRTELGRYFRLRTP